MSHTPVAALITLGTDPGTSVDHSSVPRMRLLVPRVAQHEITSCEAAGVAYNMLASNSFDRGRAAAGSVD